MPVPKADEPKSMPVLANQSGLAPRLIIERPLDDVKDSMGVRKYRHQTNADDKGSDCF